MRTSSFPTCFFYCFCIFVANHFILPGRARLEHGQGGSHHHHYCPGGGCKRQPSGLPSAEVFIASGEEEEAQKMTCGRCHPELLFLPQQVCWCHQWSRSSQHRRPGRRRQPAGHPSHRHGPQPQRTAGVPDPRWDGSDVFHRGLWHGVNSVGDMQFSRSQITKDFFLFYFFNVSALL